MTALNIMATSEWAVIFQDLARSRYEDGKITELEMKPWISADGTFAAGAIGNGMSLELLDATPMHWSFPMAVAGLEQFCDKLYERTLHRSVFGGCWGCPVRLGAGSR